MRRVVSVALLVLLLPAGARAQGVRGTVVDAGSGQPLYGSIVVLLDSAGRRVGGAISDEHGRFTLTAPAAGRYALRANRIGFRSMSSASFTLAAGETREERLAASAVPVVLSTIKVTGDERCTTRPEEGRAAFLVWDEVRKALTATVLTEQQQIRARIRQFERELDASGHAVRSERSSEQTVLTTQPFVALPVSVLEQDGYAQVADTMGLYYAPDAQVLLSDLFTAHHCFRVERDRQDGQARLGLAFEPVRDRDVPDVKGVLWVNEATGELRTLDFTYTRLPRGIPRGRFGGEIAFRQLPTGAWIVEQWVLRMPVLAIESHGRPVGYLGADTPLYRTVVAVREVGARVLSASTRDGQRIFPPLR